MNKKWSEEDIEFLKENVHFLRDDQIARQLSICNGRTVTVSAVRHKRYQLGLRKNQGRGKLGLKLD